MCLLSLVSLLVFIKQLWLGSSNYCLVAAMFSFLYQTGYWKPLKHIKLWVRVIISILPANKSLHYATSSCKRCHALCSHWDSSPAMGSNLCPLLKGQTLNKWLHDSFGNGSGVCFQTSSKKSFLFQTILKKGSIFKLSLKKYPRPGPGRPGPRPGTQAPMGYLFMSWVLIMTFDHDIYEICAWHSIMTFDHLFNYEVDHDVEHAFDR